MSDIAKAVEVPMCVIDLDGFIWPTEGSTGAPLGRVASSLPAAASESEPAGDVLAFLKAVNPVELERAAMARLGMGDGPNGPTKHILDVLKEMATT